MFKQYDQLSLEMFQKEHINILAKDEKNPTPFILWLLAYPFCLSQVDMEFILLQRLLVFDLFLMTRILKRFKVHSVNKEKITQNRVTNTDQIPAFDETWVTHCIVSVSNLLNLIKNHQHLSIHNQSSQILEHMFGFIRTKGVKYVIIDQQLIISLESTILKLKQKDTGNRQLLKSRNFQPYVKLNVNNCMNLIIVESYLYSDLLIQTKNQIQNSLMQLFVISRRFGNMQNRLFKQKALLMITSHGRMNLIEYPTVINKTGKTDVSWKILYEKLRKFLLPIFYKFCQLYHSILFIKYQFNPVSGFLTVKTTPSQPSKNYIYFNNTARQVYIVFWSVNINLVIYVVQLKLQAYFEAYYFEVNYKILKRLERTT
ncbi:Hypothetical_protein [Hexamita inflata]|uniref:Hypothetical_protein n=1 Tax=Hexamita inflata TaxID=28002 RepID=A0AA86RA85_9EUKA|nr:Hypothetical protein HINF_LOCUS22451 [Hexamita inflata]CAI9972412.1 Hypothetical protein HINF_LOCUS60057 [Hexamita inflata]